MARRRLRAPPQRASGTRRGGVRAAQAAPAGPQARPARRPFGRLADAAPPGAGRPSSPAVPFLKRGTAGTMPKINLKLNRLSL